MHVKLKCYTGNEQPGSFYIQAKGLHAGRPLKNPIRNCFVVYTDDEMLFEKVYSLWVGRYFEPHIGGSVVPFIRIGDVKDVLNIAIRSQRNNTKELQAIKQIDVLLSNIADQVKHYKELQRMLCRKINSS